MKKVIVLMVLLLNSFSFAQSEKSNQDLFSDNQGSETKKVEEVKKTDEAKNDDKNTNQTSAADMAWSKTGVDLHAKLGLPYGTAVGVDYFSDSRLWALGLVYGGFKGTSSEYDYSLSQAGIVGRWHPFASAFYVGLIVGSQTANVSAKKTISGIEAEATVEVKNSFITPNIGWMWVSTWGLSWGFELGLQTHSGATTTVKSNTSNAAILNSADYLQAEKDAKDGGDKFGKMNLPHLTLIRLGYVF